MTHRDKFQNNVAPRFPEHEGSAGIYIHIPFCLSKCDYCGFVSYPHTADLERDYIHALIHEIELRAGEDIVADTIYLGGGTPSVLGVDSVDLIIHACWRSFRLKEDPEITIEVNPAAVGASHLRDYREMGINRISLGAQSFDAELLTKMGRRHGPDDSINTFKLARSVGFDNISMDLIAGFPGQTRHTLMSDLATIESLSPEHLSIYLLEIKEDTPLWRRVQAGEITPDDDLAAEFYEMICEWAAGAGYIQYEISNFSKPGRRARHNLKYWTDSAFIGIGAAAHGMTGSNRYINLERISDYVDSLAQGRLPLASNKIMSPLERLNDAIIMGLRLTEGLDLRYLSGRYAFDLGAYIAEKLTGLEEFDLFTREGDNLRLTRKGYLLSNVVFERFV